MPKVTPRFLLSPCACFPCSRGFAKQIKFIELISVTITLWGVGDKLCRCGWGERERDDGTGTEVRSTRGRCAPSRLAEKVLRTQWWGCELLRVPTPQMDCGHVLISSACIFSPLSDSWSDLLPAQSAVRVEPARGCRRSFSYRSDLGSRQRQLELRVGQVVETSRGLAICMGTLLWNREFRIYDFLAWLEVPYDL